MSTTLGCSECLTGCCYVVAMVFFCDCQCVAISTTLGCSGLLNVVAMHLLDIIVLFLGCFGGCLGAAMSATQVF